MNGTHPRSSLRELSHQRKPLSSEKINLNRILRVWQFLGCIVEIPKAVFIHPLYWRGNNLHLYQNCLTATATLCWSSPAGCKPSPLYLCTWSCYSRAYCRDLQALRIYSNRECLVWLISEGSFMKFQLRPFSTHPRTFSAIVIANIFDFVVLLIVERIRAPPGYKPVQFGGRRFVRTLVKEARELRKNGTLSTCSITSREQTTSNCLPWAWRSSILKLEALLKRITCSSVDIWWWVLQVGFLLCVLRGHCRGSLRGIDSSHSRT